MNLRDWFKRHESKPTRLDSRAEAWAHERFADRSSAIAAKVLDIVAEQLGIDVTTILPTSRFIEDLRCVEMEDVEIVMSIEEEFGFKMPDEDAERIITVDDLIRYIEAKCLEKSLPRSAPAPPVHCD
jgi:acyl carrier protein